jgi:segregation and condensation protein A
MDYHVDLGIFRGPLDLLLHLVKRHEVEITDIPMAVITEQYLRHLEVLRAINVEAVGEFLVMASTLMEIKSKMMLPRAERAAEEPDDDPRRELVRQLVAYRQFRDAADRLDALAQQQAARLPRQQFEKPLPLLDPRQQPIQQVELWDLVSAFDRLLRATLTAPCEETLAVDETPQQDYMDEVLKRLAAAAQARLEFNDLFTPPQTRLRLVGLFLALLELIKLGRVRAEQEAAFGPIWIIRRDPAESSPLDLGATTETATDRSP